MENHPASLELFGKTVKEEIIDDTFERSHFEFEDTNDNFADTYDDKLRKVKVKEEISEHIKEEEFENNEEKNKSLKMFQCPICLKWFKTKKYIKKHILKTHEGKEGIVKIEGSRKTKTKKQNFSAS